MEEPAPSVHDPGMGGGRAIQPAYRMLLVEDNATNQNVALKMLKKLGYGADVANNGKEAVDMLKVAPYDLIFMDCMMPVMDGYEATRVIRDPASGVLFPDIPIIAMTAHAMKGDREKCLAAGMNDYISKPFQPSELAGVIERWTGAANGGPDTGNLLPAAPAEDMPPQSSVEVLDWDTLVQALMGDEGFALELVAGFLDDFHRQVSILKDAVASGNADQVRSVAHTMKGATSNIRALALSKTASDIEAAGRDRELADVDSLIRDLEDRFNLLKQEVDRISRGHMGESAR